MANHYTLFSEAIYNLTDEEEAWFRMILRDVDDMHVDEIDKLKDDLGRDVTPYIDSWPGFEWNVCEKYGGTRYLWVYSNESADLENLSMVARAFLRKFRPDDHWSFEFAFTCSKPAIGEFGGGGVFVSADEIKWSQPYSDLERWAREYGGRNARSKKDS